MMFCLFVVVGFFFVNFMRGMFYDYHFFLNFYYLRQACWIKIVSGPFDSDFILFGYCCFCYLVFTDRAT